MARYNELTHWDNYTKQMFREGHGRALWDPTPSTSIYQKIHPGYVGFSFLGTFIPIFDATGEFKDLDDSIKEVPSSFEPLPQDASATTCSVLEPYKDAFPSESPSLSSDDAALVATEKGVKWSPPSPDGAMLLTQGHVYKYDASYRQHYIDYIKKHYKSWEPFAQERGYDVHLEDIIVVTGLDLTTNFALAAVKNNPPGSNLGFSFEVGNSRVDAWGSWVDGYTSPVVNLSCGPHHSESTPSRRRIEHEDKTENDQAEEEGATQCIFIRGYKVIRRSRVRSLMKSETVSAAPETFGGWDLKWFRIGGMMIVSGSDPAYSFDPSVAIAKYIFKKINAKVAIVHDYDLTRIKLPAGPFSLHDIYKLFLTLSPEVVYDRDSRVAYLAEAKPAADASPSTEKKT